MVKEEVRQITISFTEEAYDDMVNLADKKNTTVPGLVREALGMAKWVEDLKERKGRLVVLYDGEQPQEVKIGE